MLKKLYPFRFEIFFFSQIAILFGSLIVPSSVFESVISPVLFQVNILSGILLLYKKKKLMWFLLLLLIITGIIFGVKSSGNSHGKVLGFLRMLSYFLFYIIVTVELVRQVWKSNIITKNEIFGLISGYISMGLIGFFICISIELANPNSFQGFLENISITENIMYYSYITLLTIGYGDMLPVTPMAQKASILIGLAGQIYLVVITAIVVGKYVNQKA